MVLCWVPRRARFYGGGAGGVEVVGGVVALQQLLLYSQLLGSLLLKQLGTSFSHPENSHSISVVNLDPGFSNHSFIR